MANQEHLKILKQGRDAWRQWRYATIPRIMPDLSGADLTQAALDEMDLRMADLSAAKLSGAMLVGAQLMGADLRAADLRVADLNLADLYGANLRAANLTWANLVAANLNAAKLTEANLTDSRMSSTILGKIDLRSVKGLETVNHRGPSTIGIDTIYLSQGRIPEIFLRGAGVPEAFITYMHSLAGSTFEYYSCFISYSSKDQEFAERLYADLQAKGVRCWYAPEDLKIGDKFRQRIDDAIRFHDKLLVVLSESSVRSTWVESEVGAAFERESRQDGQLVLFPIRLDDAVIDTKQSWAADIRRKRHIGDFRTWQDHNSYKKAFERLLRDLKGSEIVATP